MGVFCPEVPRSKLRFYTPTADNLAYRGTCRRPPVMQSGGAAFFISRHLLSSTTDSFCCSLDPVGNGITQPPLPPRRPADNLFHHLSITPFQFQSVGLSGCNQPFVVSFKSQTCRTPEVRS